MTYETWQERTNPRPRQLPPGARIVLRDLRAERAASARLPVAAAIVEAKARKVREARDAIEEALAARLGPERYRRLQEADHLIEEPPPT